MGHNNQIHLASPASPAFTAAETQLAEIVAAAGAARTGGGWSVTVQAGVSVVGSRNVVFLGGGGKGVGGKRKRDGGDEGEGEGGGSVKRERGRG